MINLKKIIKKNKPVEIFYKSDKKDNDTEEKIDITNINCNKAKPDETYDIINLDPSSNNFYVLEENGEIVGFLRYTKSNDNLLKIEQLYIFKKFRHNKDKNYTPGYGKKLIATIIKEEGANCNEIIVVADPDREDGNITKEDLIKYYENFRIENGKTKKIKVINK